MIPLDEYILRNTIIFCFWAEFIWTTYLSIRQFNKVKSSNVVPEELKSVTSNEVFQKAKDYTIASLKYGLFKDAYSVILTSIVIDSGLLAKVWNYSQSISPVEGEIIISCIWLFILSLILKILDLPLDIYYTFVLEERYGFNKQTAGFYLWDKTKEFFVTQIIIAMISPIIIMICKNGGPYLFIWLYVVFSAILFILLMIYPAVIAPLFDKYTPFPEGELRTQIEDLASQHNFPLTQIYVVENSMRSAHSNAYFYGIFKSKYIVVFDTLLAKDGTGCNNEEVLAVLSHELGHWFHIHNTKDLIVTEVFLLLGFAVFCAMFKYPPLYKAVGFGEVQPVLVGLFIVSEYVLKTCSTLMIFLKTCLSRKFEFQADNFVVNLGKAEPLEKALLQLHKDNLAFPIDDDWYSAWHYTHPPLLERIAVLRESAKKLK